MIIRTFSSPKLCLVRSYVFYQREKSPMTSVNSYGFQCSFQSQSIDPALDIQTSMEIYHMPLCLKLEWLSKEAAKKCLLFFFETVCTIIVIKVVATTPTHNSVSSSRWCHRLKNLWYRVSQKNFHSNAWIIGRTLFNPLFIHLYSFPDIMGDRTLSFITHVSNFCMRMGLRA